MKILFALSVAVLLMTGCQQLDKATGTTFAERCIGYTVGVAAAEQSYAERCQSQIPESGPDVGRCTNLWRATMIAQGLYNACLIKGDTR